MKPRLQPSTNEAYMEWVAAEYEAYYSDVTEWLSEFLYKETEPGETDSLEAYAATARALSDSLYGTQHRPRTQETLVSQTMRFHWHLYGRKEQHATEVDTARFISEAEIKETIAVKAGDRTIAQYINITGMEPVKKGSQ